MPEISQVLDRLTEEFLNVHTPKEDLFWETKMGLGSDPKESQRRLSQAEIAAQQFIQDANRLSALTALESDVANDDERKALRGWVRLFQANAIEDSAARALSEKIIGMEGDLQTARGQMKLGYIHPATHKFHPATSNLLSNLIQMDTDEAIRKAAFDAMLSIEPYAIEHGFLEIVKSRNKLGRMLGFEDYYDMKVQRAEGITKKELFRLLDDLEMKTRERARAAIDAIVAEKGESARDPWNFGHLRSGELSKELDPYYPFANSLGCWVRSFAALGIKYRNATLKLDLIDRKGKYENGFMHGPQPSFFNKGTWNAARINFTANAMPNKTGAGQRALQTLFHEGGHAAHFSNVLQNAPCFAQEFAPTSVAYAETQSMFLDSILDDADWRTRYARTISGQSMPFALIEKSVRRNQQIEAFNIRSMLTICYVEKALYEMSDKELTEGNVIQMAREVEQRLQFLSSGVRPVLAVPHLLAGESSAYYHGYVLAEMAVHQTREYFFEKYGYIVDNPHVGPELAATYWAPGNSERFFDLVERLTGKPFSADALVRSANRTEDEAAELARKSVEKLAQIPEYDGLLDLDASISVVHGHESITEFHNGGFERANEEFMNWVGANYPVIV